MNPAPRKEDPRLLIAVAAAIVGLALWHSRLSCPCPSSRGPGPSPLADPDRPRCCRDRHGAGDTPHQADPPHARLPARGRDRPGRRLRAATRDGRGLRLGPRRRLATDLGLGRPAGERGPGAADQHRGRADGLPGRGPRARLSPGCGARCAPTAASRSGTPPTSSPTPGGRRRTAAGSSARRWSSPAPPSSRWPVRRSTPTRSRPSPPRSPGCVATAARRRRSASTCCPRRGYGRRDCAGACAAWPGGRVSTASRRSRTSSATARDGRRTDPLELYDRRALGKGLEAKLREGATLFELQILLRVSAPDRNRAKAVMRDLQAAFATTEDRNHLRVRGLPVPGLSFLGSDLPGRRARFDRRLDTGLFRTSPAERRHRGRGRRVPEAADGLAARSRRSCARERCCPRRRRSSASPRAART